MYYIGEMEKGERRQNKSVLFSVPQYTWSLSMCIQNLKTLALIEAKKFVTENLPGEKEKWTNKGKDKSSMLILFYTIQQVIPNTCTEFQNPRHSSSWEIFDTNFPMYYTGMRDGKKEKWKKKAKINNRNLVFFPIIYLYQIIKSYMQ